MSRATSKPLLILDRLVTVLNEDMATHPDLWSATFVTVASRITAAHREAPRPAVAFHAGDGSEPQEGAVSDGGRVGIDLLHVTAYLDTADAADPQGVTLELASDFRRFLARHPQLEAEDGAAWLLCGTVHDRGYGYELDFAEGTLGSGLIEFKFDVEYQWRETDA